jgi:hypothetical protein
MHWFSSGKKLRLFLHLLKIFVFSFTTQKKRGQYTLECRGVIHIPREPECLSLRPSWLPRPSPASECVPPSWNQREGGQHSLAGKGSGRSRFGRLERKPGTLYTLCARIKFKSSCNINFDKISFVHFFTTHATVFNQDTWKVGKAVKIFFWDIKCEGSWKKMKKWQNIREKQYLFVWSH